jgi:ABC-type polysaccharide/polyol phosphate transport system ATPase subunit
MNEYAIEVNNVSMLFNLSSERIDNIKEYIIKKIHRKLTFENFYALKNVSFNVEKGDAVAIIGDNGSGKSTLLKVLAGIYKPTTGTATVRGSISPLIELGAGFDMELTGRENVYLNGLMLGYSKRFIRDNFNDIVEFASLWDFIDIPLKNYSSGMLARLGFAISTIVKPDILIVDEILAVGDIVFQRKCNKKMQELMSGGTTLLLVSHDLNEIRRICNKAVWIHQGGVVKIGEVSEVCNAYSDLR